MLAAISPHSCPIRALGWYRSEWAVGYVQAVLHGIAWERVTGRDTVSHRRRSPTRNPVHVDTNPALSYCSELFGRAAGEPHGLHVLAQAAIARQPSSL